MKRTAIPKIVKKRIEIAKLFYPLDRNHKRRIAKILNSGIEETIKYLNAYAEEMQFIQVINKDKYIIWKQNNASKIECMFCFIADATNMNLLQSLIENIQKITPTFTYVFINQKKDGDGVYDIFRFSKFSCLEHCNRVKYP